MTKVIFLFALGFGLVSFAAAEFERGKQLYLTAGGYGCAVCHGPVGDGAGQAGGYIRGATLVELKQSFIDNAPMSPLLEVLTESDLVELADYLNALGQRPLVSLNFNGDHWQGIAESFNEAQSVDLVLYNASFNAVRVDLTLLGQGVIELAALQRVSFEVQANKLRQNLKLLAVSLQSDGGL